MCSADIRQSIAKLEIKHSLEIGYCFTWHLGLRKLLDVLSPILSSNAQSALPTENHGYLMRVRIPSVQGRPLLALRNSPSFGSKRKREIQTASRIDQ